VIAAADGAFPPRSRFGAPRRAATLFGSAALVVALTTSCGIAASSPRQVTFPPASLGPSPGTTGAVSQVRGELVRVLGAHGLQLDDPRVPFRPPESARLAAAPRAVFQAILPGDPNHGFISVYEFRDEAEAAEAGHEQAAFVGSGPGRVLFPPDVRFVLRQVGTTVVFFAWSPENSADPRTADVAAAVAELGVEIPVPR